jgi:hypothetical protein
MNFKTVLLGATVAALASTAIVGAAAAQTITSGAYTAGINAYGEVYNGSVGVGLSRPGYDPIAPGSPRDSWGITGGAWADEFDFGNNGIASSSTAYGANTAVTTTMTTAGFKVVQHFTLNNNILTDKTTVTNLTGADAGLLFQRDVDWDISPTEFSEDSSSHGASAKVDESSYYGFENPNVSVPYAFSCFPTCSAGPGDLGGGIRANLGILANGASTSFNFYYGINSLDESPNGLLAQTKGAGASYVILGQSSNEGFRNSATLGFGAVPEPATWAMMLMGFFGLGSVVRKRRSAVAAA